jgi:hypothetical protein
MKALVVLVLTVAAGSGAGYLYGKQTGHLEAQRQRYELERRARIDSIRVADLVKDSTARALREASRVQDSAAAAQRGKRQAFTIVTDTTVLVVGDTTPVLGPTGAPADDRVRAGRGREAGDRLDMGGPRRFTEVLHIPTSACGDRSTTYDVARAADTPGQVACSAHRASTITLRLGSDPTTRPK